MHVHFSTAAAFTWRLRRSLLRLLSPAAFSNTLVPAIDGTASRIATFCHYKPIRSPTLLCRLELRPLVTSSLYGPIGISSIHYRSEVSWIGCGPRPRATVQPSLNDALQSGTSGNRSQWM